MRLERKLSLLIAGVFLLCIAGLGCGEGAGSKQTGIASWYGPRYHGRLTASGEVFDMEKLTAAHRTLPFGSSVRVLNLANRKELDVRINDRGPFVNGRIIDLARAAAQALDIEGVQDVEIEVLSVPVTRAADSFAVQVAAVDDQPTAVAIHAKLQSTYGDARIVVRDGDPPTWRLLTGNFGTVEDAQAFSDELSGEFSDAFVVRNDPGT